MSSNQDNSKNDLNELNSILFDTLRGIKSGTMDTKQANAVIGISNALVNNAKVQLQAIKLAGHRGTPKFLGIDGPGSNDRFEASHEVAVRDGYKNVAEAINAYGKDEFNKKVDAYISKKVD